MKMEIEVEREKLMSSFGGTIRAQRLRLKLSQEEVAQEAGISVLELEDLENNRQAATKAVLKKISRSLILSFEELTSTSNSEKREE